MNSIVYLRIVNLFIRFKSFDVKDLNCIALCEITVNIVELKNQSEGVDSVDRTESVWILLP